MEEDLGAAGAGEGEEELDEEEEGAGAGALEVVEFFMSPFLAAGAAGFEDDNMASRASAPFDLLAAAWAAEESPWAAAVVLFLFWS